MLCCYISESLCRGRRHTVVRLFVCVCVCVIMPRRSQEAYCNRAVCRLSVCLSVCHSVCNKLFSSLTENQALKQATQAELVIYSDLNWRSLVLKLRSRVMAWFAYLDCRGWRSGLYWRQNCPHLTAWRLVASICTIARRVRRNCAKKLWSTATSLGMLAYKTGWSYNDLKTAVPDSITASATATTGWHQLP